MLHQYMNENSEVYWSPSILFEIRRFENGIVCPPSWGHNVWLTSLYIPEDRDGQEYYLYERGGCFSFQLLWTLFLARRFLSPWWWRKHFLRNFSFTRGTQRNIPEDGIPYCVNSVALSPRVKSTDWATATCRRNLVPNFVDRGVSRGQGSGFSTVVKLTFLGRSR
jgi:hypothetical protein